MHRGEVLRRPLPALWDYARGLGREQLRRGLLLAGPAVVALAALLLYLNGGRYVSTDNAYVRADVVALGAEVPGTVAEVLVHENEAVTAGQLLFRLDPEPYRIALVAAEAQVEAAGAEIAALQADYRQRLAEMRQAEVDAAFSARQYARERDLAARSVSSPAGLDRTRHEAESSREHLDALREQAGGVLARLGNRPDAPVASYALYRSAAAQADRARRELRRSEVVAPVAGVVANTDRLQIGEYLAAAQPALSVVASDHVWVEANPKETDLTYLSVGNPARVSVDAYPGREWNAVVSSVSPATGAEFSVLPAQNVSGNWVKVVQRIPVRLRVELPPGAPLLRAGMSAEIEIDTGHQRSLANLFHGVGG